jgi:hypothetical protein
MPKGDAIDDLPIREIDMESRPWGETDLDIRSDRPVLVRGVEAGGLDVLRGRLVVDVWGDSSLSGDLVFAT